MSAMSLQQLKQIIEAALFVAESPMTASDLQQSVLAELSIDDVQLNQALTELEQEYQPRGVQLVQVASGYRFQTLSSLTPWLSRLWQEQAPRYSRAMLETLSLIAYRQPITRGEIEDVRGVAVSSNIIRTLTERDWIQVVGHKEVPGKPALYATTDAFLDYFSLQSLADLPSTDLFVEQNVSEEMEESPLADQPDSSDAETSQP
jgi:segregation and condensation protein B